MDIQETIGPIPKKMSTWLSADGALVAGTSAQLDSWLDHYT